jgi:hypothetical protein
MMLIDSTRYSGDECRNERYDGRERREVRREIVHSCLLHSSSYVIAHRPLSSNPINPIYHRPSFVLQTSVTSFQLTLAVTVRRRLNDGIIEHVVCASMSVVEGEVGQLPANQLVVLLSEEYRSIYIMHQDHHHRSRVSQISHIKPMAIQPQDPSGIAEPDIGPARDEGDKKGRVKGKGRALPEEKPHPPFIGFEAGLCSGLVIASCL